VSAQELMTILAGLPDLLTEKDKTVLRSLEESSKPDTDKKAD
jgi:hypothetical protein